MVVCTFISLHAAVNFYQPCSCVYVCYSVYHRQVDRERRAFPSHNWLFTHLDKKVCGISCNSPTSPVPPKVPALVNTITIITCRHKKVCTHAKSLHLPPTPIFPMLGQKRWKRLPNHTVTKHFLLNANPYYWYFELTILPYNLQRLNHRCKASLSKGQNSKKNKK